MESVLMRSTVLLRDTLRSHPMPVRQADRMAVTTVSSVCFEWSHLLLISCRRSGRKLRRLFHRRPQLSGRITADDGLDVCGLTVLEDLIYVVVRKSSSIRVFSAEAPHQRLKDVVVAGLKEPVDITSMSDSRQLYIADERQPNGCVWKMATSDMTSLYSSEKHKEFITTRFRPYTMSISAITRHLVVTITVPESSHYLYIYDADNGVYIHKVILPSNCKPLHAVEGWLGDGDDSGCAGDCGSPIYFISHTSWMGENRHNHHCVSAVDEKGETVALLDVCQNTSKRQRHEEFDRLYWPLHMSLDARGCVIVADSANSRVVLLSIRENNICLDRVLLGQSLDRVPRQPRRLFYNPHSGLLVVGLDLDGVGVYHWK